MSALTNARHRAADPLVPAEPAPDGCADRRLDLDDPSLYLNRELTWLAFNERVLNEATDLRVPLLERLKFIAIVSANLDEFFMKRIGGLKLQEAAGVTALTVDGRTPGEQIRASYDAVHRLETHRRHIFAALRSELEAEGVEIRGYADLTPEEQHELRERYIENVFPLVTPQVVDPAHPFPFISNLSLNLLVTLRQTDSDEPLLARVKVPIGQGVPRFLRINGRHRFVPLEDVMMSNLDLLFPKSEIESCELFFVTRNVNSERDEEHADDLLALIENEVRQRQFAPIVRVVVREGLDAWRRGRLAAELGLGEGDVFIRDGLLALHHLFEIAALDIPALHYPPHRPVEHPTLAASPNIFHAIRAVGSVLVQFPYESFTGSVERFLREASRDPKVRAIKMTLYRTSEQTKVIGYLADAARNGKQVAVVVELKARFDEAANIRWASRLERAGVHVTYGVLGLKTHCKVTLVVRNDFDGLRLYSHIGTGNYHAGTARLYDDVGLFSSDKVIGRDAVELFNYLTTGYAPRRTFRKILPAPRVLKDSLIDKIRREAAHQAAGNTGHIQIKVNALEDADITRELYRAGQAGVRIDLIVRDTCRLRPSLPGVSENIRVVSVVGRFLEHSRIFYFHNAGNEEFYIGSADAMMRNLEQRVEVLVPVEAASLQDALRHSLDLHLNDQRSAWDMLSDGTYRQRGIGEDSPGCQETLIEAATARERGAGDQRRPLATQPGPRRRNLELGRS